MVLPAADPYAKKYPAIPPAELPDTAPLFMQFVIVFILPVTD